MPAAVEARIPEYDLICIGFGPAALAIAVAIHDLEVPVRVLFLEKQKHFAWHAGMLLPGAKMQISFLKDLATFRDPRSHFTFLNYLKEHNRLEAFTNLDTFLPFRQEFNDYLIWAAHHFDHQVQYDTTAYSVEAMQTSQNKIIGWQIHATQGTYQQTRTTGNLIIATGGSPQLPSFLQNICPTVIHSSHYLFAVPSLLPASKPESDLDLVVVGGGQSSAEIFHDLITRYPNANITLYTANTALKPSDDSPFVNEIFNASLISTIYDLPSETRKDLTSSNRATNYSVVRPELLDELYEAQYAQRLKYGNNSNDWKHRIVSSHRLVSAELDSSNSTNISINIKININIPNIDLLICGTGYARNGHETLLQPVQQFLANSETVEGMSDVGRDYKLRFREGVLHVDDDYERSYGGVGIWLQGLCEETHGLSDSLLSILAVRAGEVVESVFGKGLMMDKKAEHKGMRNGVDGLMVKGLGSNGVVCDDGVVNDSAGDNRD